MKQSSTIRVACLAAGAVCLSLAYIVAGRWLILAVLSVMFVFWLAAKRWSVFGAASSLLFIYMLLAAMGALAHLSMPLLIGGCTAALASWDLILFGEEQTPELASNLDARRDKYHLRSLAAVAALGVALALLSSTMRVRFPFGFVIALALAAAGGLLWSSRYFGKLKDRQIREDP